MSTAVHPGITLAKRSITWSIVLSVLMILAGILAIVVPPAAGLAVTVVVGWLLIFSGVAHLVFAWHRRAVGSMIWQLLLGIVYILIGAYLLLNPVIGLVSLTFALAVYLFVAGVLEFILAVRLRPLPGSGWLFVDGVISFILAFMIWKTWPSSSFWAIGVLVGVAMFFSGMTRLMISVATRSAVSRTAP
jgi:uncharacterized membrane protein HdeD (DUF308 family)